MAEDLISNLRSGQLTDVQQDCIFKDELSRAHRPVQFGDAGSAALADRLNCSSHVDALWVSGEAQVLVSLRKSCAPRPGTAEDYDIIVERITSKTHRKGHATSALLALVEICRNLEKPRGCQLQSVVTPGGRALGSRLHRSHGWTELWSSFYSISNKRAR
jgi:hypothetical protein